MAELPWWVFLLLSASVAVASAAPPAPTVWQVDRVAVRIVSDTDADQRAGLRMARHVRRLWVRALRARGLDVALSLNGFLAFRGGRPPVSSEGRCLDRWCDDPTAPRDGESRGQGGVSVMTDTGCTTTARALVVLPDCAGLAVGQVWTSPIVCPGEAMVGGEMSPALTRVLCSRAGAAEKDAAVAAALVELGLP